jgi:transcriptional regulator with XRE-family HTH domain
MNERIGWNIRAARVKLGLSQIQLAADCNLDASYISRLERGLENPTIRTLDKIADAINVSSVDLLAKPRGKKPKPLRGGRKPK